MRSQTVSRSKGSMIWSASALLLAAIATWLAVQVPDSAVQTFSIMLAAGAGLILQKSLSWHSRAVLTGLALGSGGLLLQVTGGAAGLIVLALVTSLIVREESPSKLASISWLLGISAVIAGTMLTAHVADVPLSRLANILSLISASAWIFQSRNRGVATTTLRVAGVTAAAGVFIGWTIGRPIFAESAVSFSTTEAGVTRAAGFQSHPNEAALVLSSALVAVVFSYLIESGAAKQYTSHVWPVAAIILVGVALLMTGSRSAVLGALGAVVVFAGTKLLAGRGWRVFLISGFVGGSALLLTQLGTFAGRSLNVLEGNDGSAIYRKNVQGQLWQMADISQFVGFGFDSGSVLAENAITAGFSHIDNAWLFMLFAFGVLVPTGIILLLFSGLVRGWYRSGFGATGAVIYVAIVTSAENLWVLTGTSICVVLAVVATAEAVSNSPTLEVTTVEVKTPTLTRAVVETAVSSNSGSSSTQEVTCAIRR